ncbi:MAG: hypothetical protein Q9163_002311 [Psora crenata]
MCFLQDGEILLKSKWFTFLERIEIWALIIARHANELRGEGTIRRSVESLPEKLSLVDEYYGSYHEFTAHGCKPTELSLAIRMLIRLVILHQHQQLRDNQWKAILAFESHKELMEKSEALDEAGLSAEIRLVKALTNDDASESELADLCWRVSTMCPTTLIEFAMADRSPEHALSQIKFNQHSIDSPMQPRLGSCLVPGAALINHSCDPNTHHLSEGPELVMRSSRKIIKDEEITISYIDSTQCFEEREEALFTAYAFACQCRRCKKGFGEQGEILAGDTIIDEPIRGAKSRLDALLGGLEDGSQDPNHAEARMREICASLPSEKRWPINISPVPSLYGVLANMLQSKQQWVKALQLWLKIVYIIDPLRYPNRLNPHRVEHLMSLCQLEGLISQMREIDHGVKAAFASAEASMSVVQVYHNIQLKEDAAATLGTNNVIYKLAAYFLEVHDKQMMTGLGVTPSQWKSESAKEMRRERFKLRELELLEWAGVDLSTKTI